MKTLVFTTTRTSAAVANEALFTVLLPAGGFYHTMTGALAAFSETFFRACSFAYRAYQQAHAFYEFFDFFGHIQNEARPAGRYPGYPLVALARGRPIYGLERVPLPGLVCLGVMVKYVSSGTH